MFTSQDSSLARNLQFSLVNALLQGLTLSQMTTQHNLIVPRRKNPLQIHLTARISSLHYSTNWSPALDVSTRQCFQPSHKDSLSKFALYASLHTLLSFSLSTKPAILATLLGMPSSVCCSFFRRLIGSSSQLFWCDTRALRMVLRLVPFGHTPSSLTFWPSLGFETRCRGCPSYTAQSRVPMRLHRSSVSRIGDAAAHEAASCEQSFFGKRSTDGAIVAKWRSVRFTCSTSRKLGVRHAVLRQE